MNPISAWVSSNILLSKLIALGLIITALGAFHYYDRYTYSQHQVKEAVGALKRSYEEKIVEQQLVAKKTTDDLQKQADDALKEKDEKLKDSNTKLAAAIDELRKRPSRSTQTSTPITEVTEACNGTQLYREDAEFLTREAARADQAIIWRDYYYERYEYARKKLDELAK